jgi:tetratricopeptide (TPR) repeat protein
MLKQRVILVVLGIVLIIVIYFLPKVVIDNDASTELRTTEKASVSSQEMNSSVEGVNDLHSFELTQEDELRINSFRNDFSGNTLTYRLNIADSIARIYLAYNKFDSAAKYLEFIAVNDPSPEHNLEAADAYYESFSFAMDRERADSLGEKARYYYGLILEEQPERLDLRTKIAMTYISSANPMQGIMMLRQIIAEDPENEMALYNLGTLSIQSGQYDKSRDYFEKVVDVSPENLQARFYLALSYFELNEKENARKQFELVKSMEEDPAVIATVEGYLKKLN